MCTLGRHGRRVGEYNEEIANTCSSGSAAEDKVVVWAAPEPLTRRKGPQKSVGETEQRHEQTRTSSLLDCFERVCATEPERDDMGGEDGRGGMREGGSGEDARSGKGTGE